MKPLLGLFLLVTTGLASFCGKSGVPFSLEVLPSGAPVLGCAQPSCVAQPADDIDDSSFSIDGSGVADGFFRDGDRTKQGHLQTSKLRANCTGSFGELSCAKKNQWVGGIEYIDHPRQPLVLQCCTFEGLRFSQDVGVTTIGVGEAVTGGEVIRDGRQISFDVIANVRKVVDQEDERLVSYEVTVRRMNCLPDPPEIETPYDEEVHDEILRVLGKANNGSSHLGHEGHPHMETERKGRPEKRKKKKPRHSNRHRTDQLRGAGEEPFVGSFGAPIFNPAKEEQEQENRLPEASTYAPFPVTEAPVPRPRHIEAPSRAPPAPTQPPPPPPPQPPVQVEPTTAVPVFALPTLPPFNFLQPHNPFQLFQQPPRPLPQAFGVSQANLAPLPPPTSGIQFPHMFQYPQSPGHYNPFLPQPQPQQQQPQQQPQQPQQQQPDYGAVGAGGGFADNRAAQAQPTLAPPAYQQPFNPFAPPQHLNFGLPPGHHFNLFPQAPAYPQIQNTGLAHPIHKGLEARPELVEQQLPPTNRQLGNLFQAPAFPSLETALRNFHIQGKR